MSEHSERKLDADRKPIRPRLRKVHEMFRIDGRKQKDLAKKVGKSEGRIGLWFNKGIGEPTDAQWTVIARFFNVPKRWLLDDTQDISTRPPASHAEYEDRPIEAMVISDLDEIAVVRLMRSLAVPGPEALRRMATPSAAVAVTHAETFEKPPASGRTPKKGGRTG